MSMTLPVILHYRCGCNILKGLLGFLCYLFMIPTFVNMLTIYAYTNTHDISWGTKGLEGTSSISSKEDRFKKFRYDLLVAWIVVNMLAAYLLNQLVRRNAAELILTIFTCFLAFSLIFRLLAALVSRFKCEPSLKNLQLMDPQPLQ